MIAKSKNADTPPGDRIDRLIQERVHDPYDPRRQLSEPGVCESCGVACTGGRWQWLAQTLPDAARILCPACRRERDRVPAGHLTLRGEFVHAHRDEIMGLIRNKVDEQRRSTR